MSDISLGLYSSFDMFWYFIIFSFIGWALEVAYRYYHDEKFVNRGFLHGPFCPIYGIGIVLIFISTSTFNLVPFEFNLFNLSLLFVTTTLLSTFLEFIVGFLLMKLFNQRWWDYSDLDYNIGGFISIKFSLYWGIGGSIIYLFLDVFELNRGINLPRPFFDYIAIIFVIYFAVDFTRSIDLALRLKNFTHEVANTSKQLRSRIENSNLDLDLPNIKKLIHNNKFEELIEELSQDLSEAKKDTRILINKTLNRYDELLSTKRVKQFRHFIEAFPNIKNLEDESIFKVLRDKLDLPVIRITLSKREQKEILVGNINDTSQLVTKKDYENATAYQIITSREAWPNLSMKTIEIESDGHVENKDHTSSHLYILIEGELIAKDEKNEYILKKDNFIYFPKGANHIIINSHTKKAKLIDIVPNDRVGGK